MTAPLAVKPRNKPPIRRVPPGENRTARNFTLGVSVSLEEKTALNEIGKGLGFRGGGPLLSWVVGNLFQISKNPMHPPIWEMDFYDRLRKAGLIAPGQQPPSLVEEILPALVAQFGDALDKAFGASEKREPEPVAGASDPEGGRHGPP